MKRQRPRTKGFSLLEVAIALAILVVALGALVGHEGVAIQMSDYSNRLSQGVFLAQSKLLDVEYKLLKEQTMDMYDNCEEGDFRDEGMRNFEWKVCGYKLEMPDGAAEQLEERMMSMMAGMGIDINNLGAAAAMAGGVDPQAQGAIMGLMQAVAAVPTFLKTLEEVIRKVKVEVRWKDAVGERSLVLERFVTMLGQDRVGEQVLDTNTDPQVDGGPPPLGDR